MPDYIIEPTSIEGEAKRNRGGACQEKKRLEIVMMTMTVTMTTMMID